jgi:hypothetical protein
MRLRLVNGGHSFTEFREILYWGRGLKQNLSRKHTLVIVKREVTGTLHVHLRIHWLLVSKYLPLVNMDNYDGKN